MRIVYKWLFSYDYFSRSDTIFACSRFSGSYIKNKSERQAYIFATELLIPDNVHEEYPGEIDAYIASKIGVSPKLFSFKFIDKLY